MLQDDFHRTIDYVRISVTDRCNLRCKYCVDTNFSFVSHDEVLRYEEIVRFVRLCSDLGVTKVRLTGGEPLVRKGIVSLLGALAAIRGITDISLTTNGVFLGDRVQDLRESGLRRVNISLDTLKRDRFEYITGVDALDQVFMGIEKSIYSGLQPIKINTVIIRGFNDDEVLDFARLAAKWNLEVRFIEFMPFGDTSLWDGSRVITSETIAEIIGRSYGLSPSSQGNGGPAKTFTMDGTEGRIGFISPLSSHICATCNRIRVTARGTIRPCLFSDNEFDIRTALRDGSSDDEVRQHIREIVKKKPERKQEIGLVRKCQRNMKDIGG